MEAGRAQMREWWVSNRLLAFLSYSQFSQESVTGAWHRFWLLSFQPLPLPVLSCCKQVLWLLQVDGQAVSSKGPFA